jgi:hypothetical protein
MSEIEILQEFKSNLISFFDELIGQFPKEGDLIMIRIFLNDQIPIQDVMAHFNVAINKDDQKLRKMVKDRNETFFLEHNVFDFVEDKDKVNHFKRIWRSKSLDNQDKQVIWEWVESFIYIGDKYSRLMSKR